jgi:hypothetical protein
MEEYTVPEILRTPLEELCLQVKLVNNSPDDIQTFLNKAIESPPLIAVRNAIGMKPYKVITVFINFDAHTIKSTQMFSLTLERFVIMKLSLVWGII